VSSSALVLNVWRMLGSAPFQDVHTNSLTTAATSLTVASDATDRYEVGDRLEWIADGTYERAEVTATAATALTVRRGIDGTTAQTHDADAVFVKSPVHWAPNINKALDDALNADLYPDLYAVYEAQVTYDPTTADWYEIDAAAEDILDAYQKPDSGNVDLLPVRVSQPRWVDATLAPTHKRAFKVLYAPDNNNTIFVQYARKPAVADLSEGMQRVVEYGAMRRLLEWYGTYLLSRYDIDQGGVHAPGAAQRDARWYLAMQDEARRTEKAVLNRRFPRRKRQWLGPAHVTTASGTGYYRR